MTMDLISKGGLLVPPIILCSVVALAIFAERAIRFLCPEKARSDRRGPRGRLSRKR